MSVSKRKPSWVAVIVLLFLAFMSGYGELRLEQKIDNLRREGVHTTANVVGTSYFKASPMTSWVEFKTESGLTINTSLYIGQLAESNPVEVVYDPHDPEQVTLDSEERFPIMFILSMALIFLCFFEISVGLENLPSR